MVGRGGLNNEGIFCILITESTLRACQSPPVRLPC